MQGKFSAKQNMTNQEDLAQRGEKLSSQALDVREALFPTTPINFLDTYITNENDDVKQIAFKNEVLLQREQNKYSSPYVSTSRGLDEGMQFLERGDCNHNMKCSDDRKEVLDQQIEDFRLKTSNMDSMMEKKDKETDVRDELMESANFIADICPDRSTKHVKSRWRFAPPRITLTKVIKTNLPSIQVDLDIDTHTTDKQTRKIKDNDRVPDKATNKSKRFSLLRSKEVKVKHATDTSCAQNGDKKNIIEEVKDTKFSFTKQKKAKKKRENSSESSSSESEGISLPVDIETSLNNVGNKIATRKEERAQTYENTMLAQAVIEMEIPKRLCDLSADPTVDVDGKYASEPDYNKSKQGAENGFEKDEGKICDDAAIMNYSNGSFFSGKQCSENSEKTRGKDEKEEHELIVLEDGDGQRENEVDNSGKEKSRVSKKGKHRKATSSNKKSANSKKRGVSGSDEDADATAGKANSINKEQRKRDTLSIVSVDSGFGEEDGKRINVAGENTLEEKDKEAKKTRVALDEKDICPKDENSDDFVQRSSNKTTQGHSSRRRSSTSLAPPAVIPEDTGVRMSRTFKTLAIDEDDTEICHLRGRFSRLVRISSCPNLEDKEKTLPCISVEKCDRNLNERFTIDDFDYINDLGYCSSDTELKNSEEFKNLHPSHAILAAILANDHTLLRKIIVSGKADVNYPAPNGSYAVHVASADGKLKCLRVLLRSGADVNIRDKYGWGAIHVAVFRRHIHCVKLLLSRGANPRLESKLGVMPMNLAMYNEDANMVNLLTVTMRKSRQKRFGDWLTVSLSDSEQGSGR